MPPSITSMIYARKSGRIRARATASRRLTPSEVSPDLSAFHSGLQTPTWCASGANCEICKSLKLAESLSDFQSPYPGFESQGAHQKIQAKQ
jgi:hypothetical protein